MIIDKLDVLDRLDFAKGEGLLPLIAQHADTGEILMLGYADRSAMERSLISGHLHFFSRRRRRQWRKGETSGNTLRVLSLHADCDLDAAVALVIPAGPTCHTGARSCFDAPPMFADVAAVIDRRAVELERQPAGGGVPDPPTLSYTQRLLTDRNLRLKKLTEEAGELAVACADNETAAIAEEAADVLYHSLVACRSAGIRLEDVLAVLRRRRESA